MGKRTLWTVGLFLVLTYGAVFVTAPDVLASPCGGISCALNSNSGVIRIDDICRWDLVFRSCSFPGPGCTPTYLGNPDPFHVPWWSEQTSITNPAPDFWCHNLACSVYLSEGEMGVTITWRWVVPGYPPCPVTLVFDCPGVN